MTTLTISPVTRIEGHGKITIETDDAGQVTDTRFHVYSLRGFEEFLKGTAVERLPTLTSRICGICPVAHQLTAVKAIEDALKVTVPAPASRLRELLLAGQYLSSHLTSLGLLSLPDLLLPEAGPEKRNLVGLIEADAPLAQDVLDLRRLGTDITTTVGRRETHPAACVIGGMSKPLSEAERQDLLSDLQAAEPALRRLVDVVRSVFHGQGAEIETLGRIAAPHVGLSQDGVLALYDGQVAVVDQAGQKTTFDDAHYFDAVEEQVQEWSTMKFPVLRDGRWFRVGPLARLNVNDRIATPWAQEELEAFRAAYGRPTHATLLYHYARTIETVYAWEWAQELLSEPEIANPDVWTAVEVRAGTGIGVIEAPRGTLVHRYVIDEEGYATDIDLVVATQHNNQAINSTLRAVAPQVVKASEVPETSLNQLEMVVRAYDPCLSCATHTLELLSPSTSQLEDRRCRVLREGI